MSLTISAPFAFPQRRLKHSSVISRFCDACLIYEHEIVHSLVRYPHRQDTIWSQSIRTLGLAEDIFQTLRRKENLPETLKGLRTDDVHNAFCLAAKVIQGLMFQDAHVRRRGQRLARSNTYTQLLAAMCDAFKQYGPRRLYPDVAMYAALSAILSPLLVISPEMLLDSRCTTRWAIQRRLSDSKSV